MQEILKFVIEAVKEAGLLLISEANRPGGPRGSGGKAPVDEEIGALLTQRIGSQYPDATIVCEEGGSQAGAGKRAFFIDPNDGTRDFLQGYRENSIAVGMVEGGKHRVSVVYAPFATELTGPEGMLVTWAEGLHTMHNGLAVPPLPPKRELTEDSVVLVSTTVTGERLKTNQTLLAPAQIRNCSSIATRLALVAIGEADLAGTINNPLAPWDFAAAQGLLQAVGGELVGDQGKPIEWDGIHPCSPPQSIYFGARNQALASDAVRRLSPLLQ